MKDKEKFQVMSLIQQEVPAADIAEQLQVSYAGVLKLRREFEAAVLDGTVSSLLNTDLLVLNEVADKLSTVPLGDVVTELTDSIQGLDKLSDALQKTALNINSKTQSFLLSASSLTEIEVATEILCKLQTAFINTNKTQVNVQNNFSDPGTPKYNQFLSDKPGA